MKKTKKSILTALALGCGMAICLGVAFAPISVAQPATAETAGFYMEFGARVRNKKDSVGIRFDTVVSEEYYNGLKTTYGADAKIEFHTLVARFQDLKDVNEDEKIDETDLTTAMIAKDLQNVGANEADDLTDKGTISFATAELDGETYTYKAAMLYNADGMTYKTYAMELVARSYVKVTYMDGEEEKEYNPAIHGDEPIPLSSKAEMHREQRRIIREAKLAEKKRLRAEERARRAEERRRAKEEAMGQTLIEADIIPEDDSDLEAEAKIAEMLDNQLSEDDEDLLDDIGLDMNDIIKSMAKQAKNLPDDSQ